MAKKLKKSKVRRASKSVTPAAAHALKALLTWYDKQPGDATSSRSVILDKAAARYAKSIRG